MPRSRRRSPAAPRSRAARSSPYSGDAPGTSTVDVHRRRRRFRRRLPRGRPSSPPAFSRRPRRRCRAGGDTAFTVDVSRATGSRRSATIQLHRAARVHRPDPGRAALRRGPGRRRHLPGRLPHRHRRTSPRARDPTRSRSPGPSYLTGPYKGAPYGLSVVIHAIAGPYDLGTVVVRAAIRVDRNDAHLTVDSDPLPTILKGIPLRLRHVNVTIDRQGFLLNPTACGPHDIVSSLRSVDGASVTPSAAASRSPAATS